MNKSNPWRLWDEGLELPAASRNLELQLRDVEFLGFWGFLEFFGFLRYLGFWDFGDFWDGGNSGGEAAGFGNPLGIWSCWSRIP